MDELAALKIALVGLPVEAGGKYPVASCRAACASAPASPARWRSIPEILFLDEPTAGLDPIGAADFDQLIRGLQQSLGLTVVMVTHDLDSLVTICDRIAVLVDKRIKVGTLEELLQDDHPWIQNISTARAGAPRGTSRT